MPWVIYNILVFSLFIGVVSLIGFVYSFYMFVENMSLILEWLIFSSYSINIEMYILLDWISAVFRRVVLLISSMVIAYRIVYIQNEKHLSRFCLLVFIFIISMIFIIIRPNLIRILIGWDGLGLVSYCLVIYYHNVRSFNSGIVTVLSNRIGDVGILICIGLMLGCGCWRIYIFPSRHVLIFLVVIASITKRAQVPFSYWLPLAIAAPTPVSSLVHSSTLVTAGVYLLIRFNYYFYIRGVRCILLNLSVFTRFLSGLIANFEFDLKKIVALSTLSQLGLIMMVIRINQSGLAFYHLLVHALFKSLLFLCSGVIIHLTLNNQDIRFYGKLNELIPFVIMRFYISRLALCGLPFMSGFYSKDLVIESGYTSEINLFIIIILIFSLTLTVSYTFRLILYLFWGRSVKFYFRWFNFSGRWLINFSIFILTFLRIISGALINWIFFFDLYELYVYSLIKILTLMSCLLGVLLGTAIGLFSFLKFYFFCYFVRSMWIISLFYAYIFKVFLSYWGQALEFDKVWVEYRAKYLILHGLEKFKIVVNCSYKIYMVGLVIIILFVILLSL